MLSEPNNEPDVVRPGAGEEAPKHSATLVAFKLQPDLPDSNSNSVAELLRYHDRSFIQHLYSVIARRDPSATEFNSALTDLRSGTKSKLEIIEAIVDSEKKNGAAVVVDGLPSPTLRKLGKWPVIGPLFRILRGVTRLPVMMQDHQRFESYAIAQQQRLADFMNEEVLPAINLERTNGNAELPSTFADVIDSVMMLSDSIVELASKQTELAESLARSQDQLKQISDQSTQVSTQLSSVEEAQRQLQSQAESISREPQQLQAQIAKLVEQREESESVVRHDLVNMTQAIQALQTLFSELAKQIDAVKNQSAETAASQREFLIQEQRQIVETQKVAFNELQTQISEADQRTQSLLTSLAETVKQLHATKTE